MLLDLGEVLGLFVGVLDDGTVDEDLDHLGGLALAAEVASKRSPLRLTGPLKSRQHQAAIGKQLTVAHTAT